MPERKVFKLGITRAFDNQKNAARILNCSYDMLNKVILGERNLAPDLQPKASKAHIIIGISIAEEATGYECFNYITGDRHPQTMIRRVEKEDAETDEAIQKLPWLLIDKRGPEDLSDEEKDFLFHAGVELCERIHADLNLAIQLEDQYKIGLVEYLTKRKRPLQAAK